MRPLVTALMTALLLVTGAPALHATVSVSIYRSEDQARQHCPRDVIVWLDLQNHVYYLNGQRWYGRGKNGAFACKGEADSAGAHSSLKGP